MINYICEGDTIEVVAGANIQSGQVVVTSKLIGVAVTSANIGDVVAVKVTGVFTLPFATGATANQGDLVYWDAANKVVTATATGNTQLGYAYANAAATDTVILVKIWAA